MVGNISVCHFLVRLALDVPDNLYVMEEAEGAQDPFFGLMESHQLPSPYNIHQVHQQYNYQCSYVLYLYVWLLNI